MDNSRLKDMPEKVAKLLAEMTLEEKVAQMVQIPFAYTPRKEALEWARRGAGSFLHILGDDAREIQREALNSRLGIPVIFGIDAIHGHGLNDHATIFPSQLAAACAWDREIVRQMGRVTAREVATDGLHWTFSPVLCLGRDTRWGRIDETFGEDPYLAGELGAAIIKGYQGDDLSADDSILACAKHYIGYGDAVGARDGCDTEMTFRKLRETFLPPFAKAVEAGCATVMTAYGSIDGSPFTASKKAMQEILKEELGFDGFVVTDWDNVRHLVEDQRVAKDIEDASVMAANAGNDMIMTTHAFYEAAISAVKSGRLDISVIDDAVARILTMKYKAGLFEKPEKKGVPGCFSCEEHLAASEKAADKSIVLLENRGGILPFGENIKSIAVIGPNADDIRAQYGDWTYFTHPSPNARREPIRPYCTVLEGVREQAEKRGVSVAYHRGCGVLDEADKDIEGAVNAARGCDVTVLVLGDVVEQHGETKDRARLELSGAQEELFRAVKATGKPVITVLVASKPLAVEEVALNSNALICAFNGGMFGGRAVAKALFGELNPEGRLPISFPRHSGQVPVYYNYLSGWHGGKYMDVDKTPLYAFGYGLSYTSFEYTSFAANELRARVEVKNTGRTGGYAVTQLYIRDEVSSVMTPVKQLVAFDKRFFAPGESQTVEFELEKDMFSLITPDERRVTEPGEFMLMVGGDSRDESLLCASITLWEGTL